MCKYIHPCLRLKDSTFLPVTETSYGREMLSSLRKKCISKRNRLESMEEIAEKCLAPNIGERMTAQMLLNSVPFLSYSDYH